MASQVTTYQCPACTAPLGYDAASGKLQCEFCGSSYEVAQIEALMAEKEQKAEAAFEQAAAQPSGDGSTWDTSGMSNDWGADVAGMKSYTCPSCSAELICDDNTAFLTQIEEIVSRTYRDMQKEIHILVCHVNTIFLINLSMNILFSHCQEYFFILPIFYIRKIEINSSREL